MATELVSGDSSYEERARLRREKRELLKKNKLDITRPASPQFRTRSPTIQPSSPKNLGHISPFAYMASLGGPSPRSYLQNPRPQSPDISPGSQLTNNIQLEDSRRSSSEPPLVSPDQSEQDTVGKSTTVLLNGQPHGHTSPSRPPSVNGVGVASISPHSPVLRPYESRTPKLTKGVAANTRVIYKQDLNDDDASDITTVVLGPSSLTSDGTMARSGPVTHVIANGQAESSVCKEMVMVAAGNKSQSESSPAKGTNDSTRRKSKSTDKKNSPKSSKKNSPSKKEKKLSSGSGLSRLSLPNLYKPVSPDPLSDASDPSSPSKPRQYSFFKRKNSKKSQGTTSGNTGWTFQSTPASGDMLHSRSELYLPADKETVEPRPFSAKAIRAVSMQNLCQQIDGIEEDLNPPVTVFCSRSMQDIAEQSINDREVTILADKEHSTSPVADKLVMSNVSNDSDRSSSDTGRVFKAAAKGSGSAFGSGRGRLTKPSQAKSHDSSSDASSKQSPNEFKRFSNSRKPVRKTSVGAKDSPKFPPKKSPSSFNCKTLEEVITPPSSPKMVTDPSPKSSPKINPKLSPKMSPKFSPKMSPKFRGTQQQSPLASPKTTPTQIRRSLAERNTRKSSDLSSPKTTPVARRKSAVTPLSRNSPTSSPAAVRKSIGATPNKTPRPLSSPRPVKSEVSLSSGNVPITKKKVTPIKTSPLKSPTSTDSLPSPDTPTYRHRRSGVSSVTSPLADDGFDSIFLGKETATSPKTTEENEVSPKITISLSTTTTSSVSSALTDSQTSSTSAGSMGVTGLHPPRKEPGGTVVGTVVMAKPTASGPQQHSVTTTYVYHSLKQKEEEPSQSVKPPTQTVKYVSQGRSEASKKIAKKSSRETTGTTGVSTKVTSINIPVKPVSSPTSKKPPTGKSGTPTRKTTSTSSPAKKSSSSTKLTSPNSSTRKRSSGKGTSSPSESLKSKTETDLSDPVPQTVNILGPVNSLITAASPPEFPNSPISPPLVLSSLMARPFSPTSPPLSEPDENNDYQLSATLTPEVPIWSEQDSSKETPQGDEDSQLTYIYRSTLLRKRSKNESTDGVKMTRTPSSSSSKTQSPRHESGKPLSRTGSPRKTSLPVSAAIAATSNLRQSKLQSSVRKGSLVGDRGSIRRKTLSKLSTDSTSAAARPRSASLVPTPATTKSKSSSSLLSKSSAAVLMRDRGSIRGSKKEKIPASKLGIKSTSKSTSASDIASTDGGAISPIDKEKKAQVNKAKTTDATVASAKPTKALLNKSHSATVVINRSKEARSSIKLTSSKPPLSAAARSTASRQSIKSAKPVTTESTQHTSTLRVSRRSSAGTISKGGPNRGTLKRGTSTPNTQLSPSHAPVGRGHSSEREETFSIFDDISSMAQKNLLSSVSDHKRAVRPKIRQKPSSSHLQMLTKRDDVSSEMDTSRSSDTPNHKVDPNTYSTYMGKKVLDHSALVGLAAKLDFTTVKLRKTGIVEQMMNEQESGSPSFVKSRSETMADSSSNNYGVSLTSHPVMLLIIKGRKHVQTRLVQPIAASVNSGDVFVLVNENNLFLWQGKEANVIEKARGNDLVHRVYQKRELGCKSGGFTHIDENGSDLSKKQKLFWEILNGKNALNKDSAPSDELYERGVNMATKIYQFVQDGDTPGKFVIIHEETVTMPKISILDSKKILLFDFFSEVYVWIGKKSPPAHRKPAMVKGRKLFDNQCIPPSFKPAPVSSAGSPARKISSVASTRASGRFSSRRHSTFNSSTRRKSSRTLERKSSKGDLCQRPEWALFSRVNEGSETILFREKFSDWPEPGRIIKMKGHESSGQLVKPPPMPELQPADVKTMLKPIPKFEGLRLEGENIHRGCGNYRVSRSTFACNRVRSQAVKKYRMKEYDSVLVNEEDNGLFYSGEGYIMRWSYIITVVKELEGLTPGKGMFAMDRQYQRSKSGQEKKKKEKTSPNRTDPSEEEASSDEDVIESDEECQRVLESGGRDRCAYFFWQGHHASINEKGATAVMTVQLDEEKGPQIRVVQGTEHPAFVQLFNGSMIILYGKSDGNELSQCKKGYRLFYCGGFARKEAYLLEVNTDGVSPSFCLRSRGCYVIQHQLTRTIFVWTGIASTELLQSIARYAAKKLKKRLGYSQLSVTMEGQEHSDLRQLLGDTPLYYPITDPVSYTPRLFHLSSSTGWFISNEETHVSRPDTADIPDPFPFLQETLYSAVQPALFLLDSHYTIYLWMGWWPQQKNKLLQEKNAFSGTAFSRWAKDKKLALQTALNYAKETGRTPTPSVYVVTAGTEHLEFINMFPYWRDDPDIKSITVGSTGSDIRQRLLAEDELVKYTRTSYSLEELQKKPDEIDLNRLETYLSDKDFQTTFKMTKEEFTQLPSWKQMNLKKTHGLF